MATPKTIRGRYELNAVIGQGGMGLVYKAYDPAMKRDVAIKMLHDVSSQAVLDLFYRECDILRSLVHPNVIDILDMGDFDDEGVIRPYYVMPLLPGKTLYDLIHPSRDVTEPLSIDRGVEIIVQTARGLQAAHERELLHRDVKPRNIFVIDEYSVKLIDFGVAHLLGTTSSTGIKGTLEYMAPEQLRMKLLSRRTDIFSLGIVCYETLTGRQPFRRATEGDTADAVANYYPPLACDVNSSIPKGLSQVINKAMAKDPLSRFATASEFAEALQRARRNEPLTDLFASDEARVRRDRVRLSFEQKDFLFADEVLRELEAEGQADSEVRDLRRKVDQAILRQNTTSLYDAAERYYRANEYQLALRKVQEVLELDGSHPAALVLRRKIEDLLNERKIVEALQAAKDRLDHAAFTEARRILQDARKLRPDDTRLRDLLVEVDARQKESLKQRQELERLYQSSQTAWVQRDISQALLNLERLAELTKRTPEPRDRIMEYESFHKVVRSEHDALIAALEQASKKVSEGAFGEALSLCDQYLSKYPRHAGLTALKADIEQKQRDQQVAVRAEVERRVNEEPNLIRKIEILESARWQYPLETYYTEELQRIHDVQIEAESIVENAQNAEESGDFDKALMQWERLRSIYPAHAGLNESVARLISARERADEARKIGFTEDFEKALRQGRLDDADILLERATIAFPGEFENLRRRLDQERARKSEARRLLSEARKLAAEGHSAEALKAFRKAFEKDETDPGFKKAVIDSLLDQAKSSATRDWRVAKQYLQAARTLDKATLVPSGIFSLIDQAEQAEFVGGALVRALELEKIFDFDGALREVGTAIAKYPNDTLLLQKRAGLEAGQAEFERQRARAAVFERFEQLAQLAETNLGSRDLDQFFEEVRTLAHQYSGDPELKKAAIKVGQQLLDLQQARAKVRSGDLDGARAVAEKYLKRVPQHAGFLAIQDQIAEHERQQAVEYMAEVDRMLFSEPSLEGRIQILEEAQRRYPAEQHYGEQLEMVRTEQELVHSIKVEADALEKAGRLKEARDQWIRLGAIYRAYPGLDAQIDRLNQLYVEDRQEAKTRWTQQIEQTLKESNYAQTFELIRKARVDFPDEFQELLQQAEQGADRRARAQTLILEAQGFGTKGRWEECRRTLREAVDRAPGDPVLVRQVTEAHGKLARNAIKNDWKAAQALLAGASALDPNFKVPRELLDKIEQRKRAEIVEQALGQAKQQQGAGELQRALDTIKAGLEVYPEEVKLLQCQKDLESEFREAARREERRQALQELKQWEAVTRTIADPSELWQILHRIEGIAGDHRKDDDFNAVTDEIREQIEALETGTRLLQEGHFEESEKIATRMLKRFSDHPAFLSLQQKIAEAVESTAAAYLDDVARSVDNEPSLEGRIRILEEAERRYPTEPHYRKELEIVRAEQALVDSIRADADALEKGGRFKEALDQWNRLGAIYHAYPDLDAQIARLTHLHQQALTDAKADCSEQVQRALNEHDFAKALELIRKARVELPGEFNELLQQAEQGAGRRSQAQHLISEARVLGAKGRWEECRQTLRDAVERAPDDRVVVQEALEAHGKHARNAIKTDWKASEALLEQASSLDPNFNVPGDLLEKIAQRKRAEYVEQALRQAKQQQQAGELQTALQTIMVALEIYPEETNLVRCKHDIESDIRETGLQEERRKALAELRELESATRRIVDPSDLRQIVEQADDIVKDHKKDRELTAIADEIREEKEALEKGKQLLEQSKFDESEKIAVEMLKRFGDHAAILTLKRDIEDRRKAAAADLDQLAHRIEIEPDLAQREIILREALKRHPDQQRFREQLEAVVKQQRQVAEVVTAARKAEDDGNYAEALDDWKRLRVLYGDYPNIEEQIDRLNALQAAVRQAALTEVRASIDARQYERALELLSRLESDDAESLNLRARLNALLEAMRLLEEGRQKFGRRQYTEAVGKYREAAQKVPNERLVILILIDELVQEASTLLESDWRAAETILQAVRGLNAKHPSLAELWGRLERKQRDEKEQAARVEKLQAEPLIPTEDPSTVQRNEVQSPPPEIPIANDPASLGASRLFDKVPAPVPASEMDQLTGSPALPDAIQLGSAAQLQMRERVVREKAARELLEQATAMLAGDPAGTAALLVAAPDHLRQRSEIRNLERAALQAVEEQRAHDAAAEKTLAAATEVRSKGLLSDALSCLDNFLAAHGAHPAIAQLRRTLLKEQEDARVAAEFREFVRHARGLMALGRAEEVVALLQNPSPQFREHPEVTQLLAEAQIQVQRQAERRAALKKTLSQTAQLIRDGSFKKALEVLDAFQNRYGADAQVDEARNQIRQAESDKATRDLVEQVTSMMVDDPAGATALFGSVPEDLRKRSEIQNVERVALRALEERKTREAEAQLIEEVRKLCANHQFDVALKMLDGGRNQSPGRLEAVWQEVVAAQEKYEHERFRQETIATVHALVSRDRYEEAIAALTALTDRVPADGELLQLLADVETRHAGWAAEQKEHNIRGRLVRAKDVLDQSPGEAVRLLLGLDRDYPGRDEIAGALREAQEALASRQRRDLLQEVDRLCQREEFEAALARLDLAPPHDELTEARERLKSLQRQALERRSAEAIQAVSNIRERDPKRALKGLQELPEPLRKRPEIQAAMQDCESAIISADRLAAIAAIENMCARGKFRKARALQQEAVARLGSDSKLDQLFVEIEAGIPSERIPRWQLRVAAMVALSVVLGGGTWRYLHRAAPPIRMAVEIRTDPAGASVTLNGHSCETPDCKFDLLPGSYPVSARLDGYEAVEQTLTIGREKRLYSFNLPLHPAPSPVARVDKGPLPRQPEKSIVVEENKKKSTPSAPIPADGPVELERSAPVPAPPPPKPEPSPSVTTAPNPPDPSELAWTQVDKTKAQSLRDYLNRFRGSVHDHEASLLIADLAWKDINPKNEQDLASFIHLYPDSPHSREAQDAIASLKAETDTRQKQERAKQEVAAKQLEAQIKQISDVLDKFNATLKAQKVRDLTNNWPTVTKDYSNAVRFAKLHLEATQKPVINGDSAAVLCNQITEVVPPHAQMVTVTLKRQGDAWIIESIVSQKP